MNFEVPECVESDKIPIQKHRSCACKHNLSVFIEKIYIRQNIVNIRKTWSTIVKQMVKTKHGKHRNKYGKSSNKVVKYRQPMVRNIESQSCLVINWYT
jgi:hypothetical protein